MRKLIRTWALFDRVTGKEIPKGRFITRAAARYHQGDDVLVRKVKPKRRKP